MIKAILFDIDGVLLDSFEANLKYFQDLLQSSGFRKPTREEYEKIFYLPALDVIKKYSNLDDDGAKKVVEKGLSKDFPYRYDLLAMPEGAERILRQLSSKFNLAIVTSRAKQEVFESNDRAKLRGLFRVVISYEDTMDHKPHPAPLLEAAKRMKLNPDECIYIGDSKSDREAAEGAGMPCIIYSRKTSDIKPDTFSFIQIPGIIEKLSFSN